MADVTILGDLPSLTALSLTTTAQEVALPARCRAAYIMEKSASIQYSYDGTVYAAAPNADGFCVWSRERDGSPRSIWLKLSTGTHSCNLDCRDHI